MSWGKSVSVKKLFAAFSAIFFLTLLILTFINFKKLNDLDLDHIRTHRSYFPAPVSKIFENKLTEAFTISRIQIFSIFKL